MANINSELALKKLQYRNFSIPSVNANSENKSIHSRLSAYRESVCSINTPRQSINAQEITEESETDTATQKFKTLFNKELSKYINMTPNKDIEKSDLPMFSRNNKGPESALNCQKENFIHQLRTINNSLLFGNLFVDGLFYLVYDAVAYQMLDSVKPKLNIREVISSVKTHSVLIHFWTAPEIEEEKNIYKNIASSFIHYLFTKYGKRGISQLFRNLSFDPNGAESFRFKRKSLEDLEQGWQNFAKADISSEYNYSLFKFFYQLFKNYLLQHYFLFIIIVAIVVTNAGLIYLASQIEGDILYLIKTTAFIYSNNLSNSSQNEFFFGYSSNNKTLTNMIQDDIYNAFLKTFYLFCIWIVLLGERSLSAIIFCMIATSIGREMRLAIQNRLLKLTILEYKGLSEQFVIGAFQEDVNNLEFVISKVLPILSVIFVLGPVGVCHGFSVHWLYPFFFIFVVSFTALTMHLVNTVLKKALYQSRNAINQLSQIIQENLEGFYIINYYKLEKYWRDNYDKLVKSSRLTRKTWKYFFLINLLHETYILLIRFDIVISLGLIAFFITFANKRFDEAYTAFLIFSRVLQASTGVVNMISFIYSAALSMGRLDSLKLKPYERYKLCCGCIPTFLKRREKDENITENIHAFESDGAIKDAIVLENVYLSFSVTSAYWSAYNINMNIKFGEKIALVGVTGSGKSTLVNLIIGALTPTRGIIKINGQSLNEFKSFDKFFGLVCQHNHIFNLSIRNNLKLFNNEITDELMYTAAKKCLIHDWVVSLPLEYDTIISKGATNVSGGQLQRIALARMLLYQPKVVVVDECTSHLDPKTGKEINDTLFQFCQDRTLIYSTNTLEMIDQFDRIFVIENGCIVQCGSHIELLIQKENDCYKKMFQKFNTARRNSQLSQTSI